MVECIDHSLETTADVATVSHPMKSRAAFADGVIYQTEEEYT